MNGFVIKPSVPTENLQKLVAAMVAQAVEDYKALEARGFIDHGNVVMERTDWAKRSGKIYLVSQVNGLVYFFTSKTLEEWLDSAQLQISASRIRKELRIV